MVVLIIELIGLVSIEIALMLGHWGRRLGDSVCDAGLSVLWPVGFGGKSLKMLCQEQHIIFFSVDLEAFD